MAVIKSLKNCCGARNEQEIRSVTQSYIVRLGRRRLFHVTLLSSNYSRVNYFTNMKSYTPLNWYLIVSSRLVLIIFPLRPQLSTVIISIVGRAQIIGRTIGHSPRLLSGTKIWAIVCRCGGVACPRPIHKTDHMYDSCIFYCRPRSRRAYTSQSVDLCHLIYFVRSV